VNHEAQQYLALLDRRVALLGALAETLAASRQDIACLDVDGLQARISRQESLCQEVGTLDGQLDRLQEQCARTLHAGEAQFTGPDRAIFADELAGTQARMKRAQARVKALNQTHQALLRRCRRTAGALLNSYATFTATYVDPGREGLASRHQIAQQPSYGGL
jgi:hypothetical protein